MTMEILKAPPMYILAGTLFLFVLLALRTVPLVVKSFTEKKNGNGNNDLMRGLVDALTEQGKNSGAQLEVQREILFESKEARRNTEQLLNTVINNQATIVAKEETIIALVQK